MAFKVFDMVKPPGEQGLAEGSYDMVLASNVLHVAEDLDGMMSNVRRLLRPGGFLVNLETTTNDMMRNGVIMGGLPGWWIGAESGRPHGPMLSLDAWDGLLRRQGFGGIESCTPVYDSLHAVAVWAARARDDRVDILRNPTAASPELFAPETLVLVGGMSLATFRLMEQVKSALGSKFSALVHLPSVAAMTMESLPSGATVLSIADLDEPVMRSMTEAKLEGLKALWTQARNILWVSRGARSDEPYANMMFGIGRVVRFEHPNINLQMLDVDAIDEGTGDLIISTLLRHQLLDTWRRDGETEDLLWSSEPEIFVEKGQAVIPRLLPNELQNLRVNSEHRAIFRDVNLADSTVRIVQDGQSLDVEEISPLEDNAATAGGLVPRASIRVKQSLLQRLRLGRLGRLMLCVGTVADDASSHVLALTSASTSTIPAELLLCSVDIPGSAEFGKMAILTVAAHLVASQVLATVPKNGTLLVHEPDNLVKAAITLQASRRNIKTFFTTTRGLADNKLGNECTAIHPDTPTRLLKERIPHGTSVFVDFSTPDSHGADVGRSLSQLLPSSCESATTASFFGTKDQGQPVKRTESLDAEHALQQAWADATTFAMSIDTARTVSLGDIPSYKPAQESLAVVDWTGPTVPVRVRPIDNGDIFRPDRTYLMVGMSGEVGQSLCQWMVRHGARYIVLTSRKPQVDPEFIRSLENRAATVRVMSLDIADRGSLERCLAEIKRSMPEIAGISNGALVVADSRFDQMSLDSLDRVLRPKVEGSKLLDEFFRETPLDFFIMFSSLTACLGNSGQSNYAAANMFMTTLAFQRRRRGVAGSVIDLSSLMGIGHVGRSDVFDADYFASLGATNLSEPDLHAIFAEAVHVGRPGSADSAEVVTGMSPMTPEAVELTKVKYRRDLKFSHFTIEQSDALGSAGAASSAVSVRAQLKGATSSNQVTEILLGKYLSPTTSNMWRMRTL